MKQKHVILGSFLINLVFLILGLVILSHIPVSSLRLWIHRFGFIGIFVYIAIYFFLFIIPFNPIPKNVITYFALVSFGPLVALITTLFADLLAVLVNYFLAYRFYHFSPNTFRKTLHEFQHISFWALLIARIVPITEGFVGADFPSYAAGAIKMPLVSFLAGTFLPWIIIDTIYFFSLEHFIGNRYIIPVFTIIIGFSIFQIIIKLRKK